MAGAHLVINAGKERRVIVGPDVERPYGAIEFEVAQVVHQREGFILVLTTERLSRTCLLAPGIRSRLNYNKSHQRRFVDRGSIVPTRAAKAESLARPQSSKTLDCISRG